RAHHVHRDHCLVVSQSSTDRAIPWHSVLRLHLLPAGAVIGGTPAIEYPVVGPLGETLVGAAAVPMLPLGHGLKRAYFVADRLIWRLIADPSPAEQPS